MPTILANIESPADVQKLTTEEKTALAAEIRARILDTVSDTGGHLAANLGVVELTIAILGVFDPPDDAVVWDTSHQCYTWKLLTGRRDRFHTLRQSGGISGFCRRSESPCDTFGAGHAGTALSAALGLAVARDRRGDRRHVLAVIGDAAMANGVTLEALNNLAGTTQRLIVVLNDNEMSISGTVGSLARYFGKLLANPHYNRWKGSLERLAMRLRLRPLRRSYHRLEEALKSLVLDNLFFEPFGLRYIGPIDGHRLPELEAALRIARDETRPVLLHVNTRKGHGYAPAEREPSKWHGTCSFDVVSGQKSGAASHPTYSTVFGDSLVRLAERDDRICAITAAMCSGTGLDAFARRFPDRFFDVGICEAHALTFAAGLAAAGLRPVVALYSSFLQRAVDHVAHDICLQDLPVILGVDRAGLVGDDGPTHHGVFDIAMLRCVPGLQMAQPADEDELDAMLRGAVDRSQPLALRYPRGAGPGMAVSGSTGIEWGRAHVECAPSGAEVCFWALGDMLPLARASATVLSDAGFPCGVVNARFIKPLDGDLLLRQVREGVRLFVSFENGAVTGGFGSAILEHLVEQGMNVPVMRLGWPDVFVAHGAPEDLWREHGLVPDVVADRVRTALAKPTT